MGMLHRIRRGLGGLALLASVGLLGLVLLAYAVKVDQLAAMAVMPIWIWGLHGLVLHGIARWRLTARATWLGLGLWLAVSIGFADESDVLRHFDCPLPTRQRPGGDMLRVITYNVAQLRQGDPTSELKAWQPDLVLLQEVPAHRVRHLATALYGEQAYWHAHQGNGIVSRWPLLAKKARPARPQIAIHQIVSLDHPVGPLQVINVHLPSAATDLRLWRLDCWQHHQAARQQRRDELAKILALLTPATDPPTLLAGDFNAGPWDPIHDQLEAQFTDAFEHAGRGWGNTYHRRLPLLRIDQIHLDACFDILGCRAVRTPHSDHRFVVADLRAAASESPRTPP